MDTTPAPVHNHRGSGWTLWREIYGTFIGVLPLIVVVCTVAFQTVLDNRENRLKIAYLEKENVRIEAQVKGVREDADKQRVELLGKLDRIALQIESLQTGVALINGRGKP